MTVRKAIEAELKADWADIPELQDVWVIATQNQLEPFTRTTAVLSQQSFARFPQAPIASRNVGLTLEVVSHLSNRDDAADELEPVVLAIFDYFAPRYAHEPAEAFLYGTQFAYRIPFTVVATQTQE